MVSLRCCVMISQVKFAPMASAYGRSLHKVVETDGQLWIHRKAYNCTVDMSLNRSHQKVWISWISLCD